MLRCQRTGHWPNVHSGFRTGLVATSSALVLGSLALGSGTASANPDPSGPLFFGLGPALSILFALGMEAAVVAGILALVGLYFRKGFTGYLLLNVGVYVFVFRPLLEFTDIPVLLLEIGVVVIDAAAVKLLARIEALHADTFVGLSWRMAAGIAVIGNLVSYLLGIAVVYVHPK